ncbi:glycoside hydrolase family 15 protein [Pendulispora brunnea]|uniref:Glycoside hydrolase family 15 protein n=1 Tax=Pendulispora brunnea TaxID=2905690 RepID=A0ABZ2KBS0_9BACT
MHSPRIHDYGIIGDGRSAALVSREGAIDWLCWPRFDSASLLAAALDAAKGGHWRVTPIATLRTRRSYQRDSNILVTTFETSTGEARLTDSMTVFGEDDTRRMLVPEHELLRMIECIRGEVEIDLEFQPRPDYARKTLSLRSAGTLGMRLEHGHALYTLRGDEALQLRDSVVVGRFGLRAGERRCFSLTFDTEAPAVLPPLGGAAPARIERTAMWWRRWASRCTYSGRYRERVMRSLLVLKLLCHAPSGAIVAAPTTSFPERWGADLNWDYRYCWPRDASLTVRALLELGYVEEAIAFVSWLLHSTRLTQPELCVLYDVYGEVPRKEQTLTHLTGFRGSRPVRVGNAAAAQIQLDVYGEVIDAVAQMCRWGLRLDAETQRMLRRFGKYVCANWRKPDHGLWEPREDPSHHTHSRLLCWTALDRLLELHGRGHVRRIPMNVFHDERRAIRAEIEEKAWNPRLHSYTHVLGGEAVDASLLLLAWYGFTDVRAPRMRDTFERVRKCLIARPGLLFRGEGSRAQGEGAFGICSFWVAELLARSDETFEEAELWFEQTLSYANDLGLFAEEMDLETGEALGNFPQAFTHVGLICAALAIEARRAAKGAVDELG